MKNKINSSKEKNNLVANYPAIGPGSRPVSARRSVEPTAEIKYSFMENKINSSKEKTNLVSNWPGAGSGSWPVLAPNSLLLWSSKLNTILIALTKLKLFTSKL